MNDQVQLNVTALPSVAREIADLIGLPKTLKLVDVLGGTTFPVPKRETKLGELRYEMLAEVVGGDAASALAARFGGTDLYIPRCSKALRGVRDAEIIAYFDREAKKESANAVVAKIALRYKLSDRRVWVILKGIESRIEQQPLQISLRNARVGV